MFPKTHKTKQNNTKPQKKQKFLDVLSIFSKRRPHPCIEKLPY